MGSSSLILVLAGIIKNKVVAVILGPSGIGLFGLLQTVLSTAATIAGMGLANSGVRQVVEAHTSDDSELLAVTGRVLWWASFASGILGAVFLLLFSKPIARLALGNDDYARTIAWLGLAVWATTSSGAQTALLNGLRRLGDLAKASIAGALISMPIAVIAVWLWDMQGVVVAVVSSAFITLGASWWYSRRVILVNVRMSLQDIASSLHGLLSLGFVFMLSAVMTVATQFLVRVILTRELGLEATGHFQAAWSISMLYLGFVLSAMGTDYYPRLTAVAKDRQASNFMVNEQTEVALLLSGPVILGMLTFAPQLVTLLYAKGFSETVTILRWQVLGDIFKVACWPMGFVMLAQGNSRLFFLAELSWNVIYLALLAIGLKFWGLQSAGIAFLLAYVFLFCLNWLFAYRLNRFVMSPGNLFLFILNAGSATFIFLIAGSYGIFSQLLAFLLTLGMGVYSFRRMSVLLGGFSLSRFFKGKDKT